MVLIQSVTNIFEYSNIQIFLIRISIRILVRLIFWKRIYSDICSCLLFGYKYIWIFVRSKILIWIYLDINLYQCSGHGQILAMFLFNFSGYYILLVDILLVTMIKILIQIYSDFVHVKKFIRIYSYNRLCHFLDMNIFRDSSVSKSIRMSHSGGYGKWR